MENGLTIFIVDSKAKIESLNEPIYQKELNLSDKVTALALRVVEFFNEFPCVESHEDQKALKNLLGKEWINFIETKAKEYDPLEVISYRFFDREKEYQQLMESKKLNPEEAELLRKIIVNLSKKKKCLITEDAFVETSFIARIFDADPAKAKQIDMEIKENQLKISKLLGIDFETTKSIPEQNKKVQLIMLSRLQKTKNAILAIPSRSLNPLNLYTSQFRQNQKV